MATFRVHIESAPPVEVSADTPEQARKIVGKKHPGAVVRKIKLVREIVGKKHPGAVVRKIKLVREIA